MRVLILVFFLGVFLFSLASIADPNGVPAGHYTRGRIYKSVNMFQKIKTSFKNAESVSPEAFQYSTSAMAEALGKINVWAKKLKNKIKVGDISVKNGGKIGLHTTHQIGLGVDIAYVAVNPSTSGHRFKRYHNRFTDLYEKNNQVTANFDRAKNFELLSFITKELPIKKIFVGCKILKVFESMDTSPNKSVYRYLIARKGHEDHFHMRLTCPPNAPKCHDGWRGYFSANSQTKTTNCYRK